MITHFNSDKKHWHESYSFLARLTQLVCEYAEASGNEDKRNGITERLAELITQYEPRATQPIFDIRRKTWKDLYPSFWGRQRAKLGYLLFSHHVTGSFTWVHLLLGYKVWVRLDFSTFSVKDILAIADARHKIVGSKTEFESMFMALIEDSIKLRPVAVLATPSGKAACRIQYTIPDDEKECHEFESEITFKKVRRKYSSTDRFEGS